MENNHPICGHKYCGRPAMKGYGMFRSVQQDDGSWEQVAFHTDCFHAHPDYDVTKGCGSPFTTITRTGVEVI